MIELSERTPLATSVEETFELVCDFARLVEWDPAVTASERTSGGRLEAGSRYRIRVRFLGRTPEVEYELLAADPPRRVHYRAEAAWLSADDTLELEASGDGTLLVASTRVRLHERLSPAGPLIEQVLRRQARASVARLRAVCQSRARARLTGAHH